MNISIIYLQSRGENLLVFNMNVLYIRIKLRASLHGCAGEFENSKSDTSHSVVEEFFCLIILLGFSKYPLCFNHCRCSLISEAEQGVFFLQNINPLEF